MELAVGAVLVSVPLLLLALGITVSAAEALLDGLWLLLLVLGATAAFCFWACTSVLIEGVNAFFEVRAELMPQGFAVVPMETQAAASTPSTRPGAPSGHDDRVR